jgi:quinol monooxygenase YgiN
MILVTTYMKCEPGDREAFVKAAQPVLVRSRAEKGCLDYRLFEDVESPGKFVWVERWEEESNLNSHFYSDHAKEFRSFIDGVVSESSTFAHEIAATRLLHPDTEE